MQIHANIARWMKIQSINVKREYKHIVYNFPILLHAKYEVYSTDVWICTALRFSTKLNVTKNQTWTKLSFITKHVWKNMNYVIFNMYFEFTIIINSLFKK